MSWANKAHKKIQAEKMAKELMNTPQYREARRRDRESATIHALGMFMFMGMIWLEMNFNCKRKGLLRFLDFVKATVIDFKNDPNWLEASDAYFKETYNIDALGYLGMEVVKENEDGEG
jgi:hypothetical protein